MEDTIKNKLIEAGINVDSAMERFLDDEEMYFEFLNQFPEDDLMGRLNNAVDNNRIKEAFDTAHTLKGVCANLSIDSMNKIINPMVEILRDNSIDGVPETLAELFKVYERVLAAINECCK